MMHDAIKSFPEQFSYEPKIKNGEKLSTYKWYLVVGMGGSHLAADLLSIGKSEPLILVHKNYGLPAVPEEILQKSLVVASSYSGNTEETIDAYQEAKNKNLPVAIISTGGKLLELAKLHGDPYIEIPNTKIQPRSATGFMVKALLAIMKDKDSLIEISKLTKLLNPKELESDGKKLADSLFGKIPVIYSSQLNEAIALNWKIKFNETGKVPAFYNVFPELNHNEMTGFDVMEKTKSLSEKICFIFLKDKTDHPKIQKRMEITKKLYEKRGLAVVEVDLKGQNIFHKIFSSLVLADWTAYYTAKLYNVEPEKVPMVEEFKKLIS